MLFFICTISSPFFAFDKAKLLGSGLIFFSALYKKSQSAECISFRTVSVSPVFSVCEGLAQSQSLLPRSKTEDIGSGSAHLGNGRLQKARHGGFLLVERSLVDAFPVSLLNSCPPSPFSVCARMRAYTSMPACVHCRATFLMGKHVYVCLQLKLQESHEMEILGNYSSSSVFKLLLPNITR